VRVAELVYLDDEAQTAITIAALDRPDDGRRIRGADGKAWLPNDAMYATTDLVQAERWRCLVAAGGWPDDLPTPVVLRGDAERLYPN